VLSTRSRRARLAAVPVVLALLAAAAVYAALHQAALPPQAAGSGCEVRAGRQAFSLAASQAALAATIAGVAQRRSLPGRAVTVAYAAALQESKLQNLGYGDRDSVGIFQQRPSQGWGPARLLQDPVYATTKFFAALAAVPRYQALPVYQAAQAVQRSADGSAYDQYAAPAAVMAAAFTGRAAGGVWCWYGGAITGRPRLRAAAGQLLRTFGRQGISAADGRVLAVARPATRADWAQAAWLVSHAPGYGIRAVRCAGLQWTAARGAAGWTRLPARQGSTDRAAAKPPPGTVLVG